MDYQDDYPFDNLQQALLAAIIHDDAYCACESCHQKRAARIEELCKQFLEEEAQRPPRPKKSLKLVQEWLEGDTRAGIATRITRPRNTNGGNQ